jgi:hypothetical protein
LIGMFDHAAGIQLLVLGKVQTGSPRPIEAARSEPGNVLRGTLFN